MEELGTLMPTNERWLEVIYSEAWKQYCHEDNIGQSRTNFFMGFQTAIFTVWIAILAVIAICAKEGVDKVGPHVYLLFGIFTLVVGVLGLVSSLAWKGVTEAGRRYLNLRWVSALVSIEKLAQVEKIGLANIEHDWKQYSREELKKTRKERNNRYYPFQNVENLKDFWISLSPNISGWNSMGIVIWCWIVVNLLISALGVVLCVWMLFDK